MEDYEQSSPSNLHQTQSQQSSMVVIRDTQQANDCSIFPPINHENLQIPSFSPTISTSPSSSSLSASDSSFSPSDDSDICATSSSLSLSSDSPVEKTDDGFSGWLRLGFKTLLGKVLAMLCSYPTYVASKNAVFSVGPAVIFCWWLCMRLWRWLWQRRRRRENHLMSVIREKDQIIAQLLERIVQMNEILVAHHKALAAKLAE